MAWALYVRGIDYVLHYLDDFLFVGPPRFRDAAQAMVMATSVFSELGAPVVTHKTEGPSAQVSFLGFMVDTEAFQMRLPNDKLRWLKALVREWQGKWACTRREMESLVGHLSHAAAAIRPGRLFLRQLFALLPSAPKPYHFIRLNLSVRADLCWWAFLLRANGTGYHYSLQKPPRCTCSQMPLGVTAVAQ